MILGSEIISLCGRMQVDVLVDCLSMTSKLSLIHVWTETDPNDDSVCIPCLWFVAHTMDVET